MDNASVIFSENHFSLRNISSVKTNKAPQRLHTSVMKKNYKYTVLRISSFFRINKISINYFRITFSTYIVFLDLYCIFIIFYLDYFELYFSFFLQKKIFYSSLLSRLQIVVQIFHDKTMRNDFVFYSWHQV